MSVVVMGGTGTVGSQTVRTLLARGVDVRVVTRDPRKLASLPEGVRGVIGDAERPETLPEAFRGAESVFLITALSPGESANGVAAVRAAVTAGVLRIVQLSVPIPPGSEHIPHFASKIPIEQAVRESGLVWTILRPNNFFQNDLWFREAITAFGVYPQPIGTKGMNRVDVRDISDVAANVLTQPGHHAQQYPIHGPDALTGTDVAGTYGRHLGREVRYAGDDLDAWAASASRMMPEWMVHDLRIMYAYFQERGFPASPAALADQQRVLGHAPRRFDDFVAELAPSWKR